MCPPQKNQVAEWFCRRKAFEKMALQLCTPPSPPLRQVAGYVAAHIAPICFPETDSLAGERRRLSVPLGQMRKERKSVLPTCQKKGGVAKHFLERNLFYEITLCLHKRVFLRFARVLGGTQRWSRLVAQKNDGMVQKDAIKGGTH